MKSRHDFAWIERGMQKSNKWKQAGRIIIFQRSRIVADFSSNAQIGAKCVGLCIHISPHMNG